MGRSKEKGVDDKGVSDTEIDAKILFDEYILKNAQNGCVALSTFQTIYRFRSEKARTADSRKRGCAGIFGRRG